MSRLKPGKGGQIARAAGTYVQVVGRDKGMVIVRLNSGEQRYVRSDCMATVGAVSNPDNQNQTLAKAGRTRWLGKRPLTRGVARTRSTTRTAVARAGLGRHPVTPWGKPTKGARTRHNKLDRQDDHPVASRGRRVTDGSFRLERSVRRTVALKKAEAAQGSQPRADQDLVAPLDHPAAVRRPDLQCLQRPQVRAGVGQRTWSA